MSKSSKKLNIVHLAASPFLGGPERQMLGLGQHLPKNCRSTYISFSEKKKCRALLDEASRLGFGAIELKQNVPNFRLSVQEITHWLRKLQADILCCHGYKPDLLGLAAGRRSGLPVISVSHGWTGSTLKVRLYDTLDCCCLRLMNAVVCVSQQQVKKVKQAGVSPKKVHLIRNAIDVSSFEQFDESYRQQLLQFFPYPVTYVVGAAGRFSPEKGFAQLIEAAGIVLQNRSDVGFVIFGDGPLRQEFDGLIRKKQLQEKIILPGFRTDLNRWFPGFDLMVLSSFTEGLPVVVLESFASRVPVVATAVGGTPEVVKDGHNGYLVPASDVKLLANRIEALLANPDQRKQMGQNGYDRVEREFTFKSQAEAYYELFEKEISNRQAVILLP